MITEITRDGKLIIAAETPLEEFALATWGEANAEKIPHTMLVLCDRTVPIAEALQTFNSPEESGE